jgi:N-acetylglucosamine kinase-like BadF-type ATPase
VTTLTDRFLREIGVSEPMDLIPAVYRGGGDRAALAALAPLVLTAASQGDAIAREIVREAADQLARAVAAAATALHLTLTSLPLAITGGTLLGNDQYRQAVLHSLAERGVQPEPVRLVHEPAEGGVRLAWAADVATTPVAG